MSVNDPNTKTVLIDHRDVTRQISAVLEKVEPITEIRISVVEIRARIDSFAVQSGKLEERVGRLENKLDDSSRNMERFDRTMMMVQKDVDIIKTKGERGDSRRWTVVQMVMTPVVGLMFGALVWLFGQMRDMETRESKMEARYAEVIKQLKTDPVR